MVDAFACVQIKPGSYLLDQGISMPSGSTLIGSGRSGSNTTVLAPSSNYIYSFADALVYASSGATNLFYLGHLVLNGQGLATYGAGYSGMTIEDTEITRTRCSAIGILGPGMVINNNLMTLNAQPTSLPGGGHFGCDTPPVNWDACSMCVWSLTVGCANGFKSASAELNQQTSLVRNTGPKSRTSKQFLAPFSVGFDCGQFDVIFSKND
jgi:hypothetical protein